MNKSGPRTGVAAPLTLQFVQRLVNTAAGHHRAHHLRSISLPFLKRITVGMFITP